MFSKILSEFQSGFGHFFVTLNRLVNASWTKSFLPQQNSRVTNVEGSVNAVFSLANLVMIG